MILGTDLSSALKALAEVQHASNGIVSIRADRSRAVPILREALAAWNKPNPYKAGDILKAASHSALWKSSVGHVIVVKVLPETESDTDDSVVQSWDMTILALQDSGAAVEYTAHSRDFELVEPAT